MGAQQLWKPTPVYAQQTRAFALMQQLGQPDWWALHQFSITEQDRFWNALWDFLEIIGEKKGPAFVPASDGCIMGARYFPDSTLNFAQNCLRRRDETPAIYFRDERGMRDVLTWRQLYTRVAHLAHFFKEVGLKSGDRVCAMLPNCPQAVITFLACMVHGIVFSSCSPDFGEDGVIDRFGQIKPKIFVVCDQYQYHGHPILCIAKAKAIIPLIPSLEHVIVVPTMDQKTHFGDDDLKPQVHMWPYLVDDQKNAEELVFTPLPFAHPATILYSSGTTGKPKCIVHASGNMLLQLMKEHQIHCDIRPKDRVFYFTTCGWMMWDWLVAALASQATLCLYDGSPKFPHNATFFEYVQDGAITHMGVSAKLISIWDKDNLIPKDRYTLESLRMILSTGSPLLEKQFSYIYHAVKQDILLASISGGTDIASCFVLGCPLLPVYAGQIQTAGLGQHVEIYTDKGAPAIVGEKGELVCTKPFMAMPLGFYNDPDKQKYKATYFEHFSNTWYHGDFAQKTSENGFIIYGRSDATLKPGGIRIGTSEIYTQVEKNAAIEEALVVGQNWHNDVRIILFVQLRDGLKLNDTLIEELKKSIRKHLSPHHVPQKIIAVPDFPRTRSGKLSELLVRDIIHHVTPKNLQAIANPETVNYFQSLKDLQY